MDVLVIDDAISLNEQVKLEQLCFSREFPWGYYESANYGKIENNIKEVNENAIDTFSFNHYLYDNIFSNYYPPFKVLLSPINCKKLIRFKLNITTYDPRYKENNYGIPHCDMSDMPGSDKIKGYKTAIYYVNDSTGDTFIFNEKFGSDTSNLTVKKRISPKRGRMVIFDGEYLHAGNCPINETPRVVANINML
jgi:hypothetical protein